LVHQQLSDEAPMVVAAPPPATVSKNPSGREPGFFTWNCQWGRRGAEFRGRPAPCVTHSRIRSSRISPFFLPGQLAPSYLVPTLTINFHTAFPLGTNGAEARNRFYRARHGGSTPITTLLRVCLPPARSFGEHAGYRNGRRFQFRRRSRKPSPALYVVKQAPFPIRAEANDDGSFLLLAASRDFRSLVAGRPCSARNRLRLELRAVFPPKGGTKAERGPILLLASLSRGRRAQQTWDVQRFETDTKLCQATKGHERPRTPKRSAARARPADQRAAQGSRTTKRRMVTGSKRSTLGPLWVRRQIGVPLANREQRPNRDARTPGCQRPTTLLRIPTKSVGGRIGRTPHGERPPPGSRFTPTPRIASRVGQGCKNLAIESRENPSVLLPSDKQTNR